MSGREIDRREFVRLSAAAGGAFLLAVALPRRALGMEDVGAAERPRDDAFAPNLWLRIDPTGDITILSHKSEMGQGVWTALPMIVAEELDADWDRVRIERAPTTADFDSATGGSSSVSDSWDTLRKAGAVARAMLVAAAAQQWHVPADSCTTERGVVAHAASGRRAPYGSLVSAAANLPVPNASTVSLKDPHAFRIVGTEMPRRDLMAKVTGTAQFGIDVTLPNMLVACIARCPSFRGKVSRVDDARARAVPGVRQVLQLDPVPKQHPGRVAVLADDTWAALQGCRALDIEWDTSVDASVSTDGMWRAAREAVSDDASALVVATQGASPNGAGRGRTVEATYELPFVAHACMEPMNCTAWVTADRARIWAPTQFPEAARETVAGLTGLPLDKVDVHVTFLGGGFGRRAYQDFVIEAADLSKRAGVPVKVMWTREDDIQHDLYRPAQLQRLSA
ncbi:MAG TPA: molybdopterin cofactor-binding domain-containing protein, partial [Gemmatimonadaceae bacterium]|nr:molybdopterin cofactor-binding domain-containing protein [Gemmatimonadaceae bacterium]